jgi:hypothetical protein
MEVPNLPAKETSMQRALSIVMLPILLLLAAGCEMSQGTSRPLGTDNYEVAFATSEEVLSRYFELRSSNPNTGVIESAPLPGDAESVRLLSSGPSRRIARMRLRNQEDGVHATLLIEVQQQGSQGFSEMDFNRQNYDGIPRQTPAERQGATTPEQNDLWTTTRRDRGMEVKILGEIRDRLQPAPGLLIDDTQ